MVSTTNKLSSINSIFLIVKILALFFFFYLGLEPATVTQKRRVGERPSCKQGGLDKKEVDSCFMSESPEQVSSFVALKEKKNMRGL